MLPDDLIAAHRARALSPDHPVIRGTAQNPDTFFQAREACTPFYERCPGIVQDVMDEFDVRTGRRYRLFEYDGDPAADRVLVVMGSAAETAHETVDWLCARGERVGVVKVRLYRPFSAAHLLAALPSSTRAIAVLDRTKEPGALGEPLYLDVLTALAESAPADRARPTVVGGRYGLSSKELTPAMLAGVFGELSRPSPRQHFTVGIVDDVSHSSLEWDRDLDIEPDTVSRSVFFGLGADGTVGANKNSIKIIGDATPGYAQGYFVYDSKKSGAITVSHLRFGPSPIRSAYLIRQAGFVGCHQFAFLDRYDVIDAAAPGAVLLVNSPYGAEDVWDRLNAEVQAGILDKRLRLYVIDALDVARRNGMGTRINTIMQTCFFALSGVLPRDEAIVRIKDAIAYTYAQARRRRRAQELRGRRRHAGASARGAAARCGVQRPRAAAGGAGRRTGFRRTRHGDDDRRQGRPAARERLPRRRHVADGDVAMGEARHRGRGPGVGRRPVHPVQQVRVRLPARRHPRQGLPGGGAGGRSGQLRLAAVQGQGIRRRRDLHPPGRARRLHRLLAVRAGLSGARQGQPAPQVARAAAAAGGRAAAARQLRVLPRAARGRSGAASSSTSRARSSCSRCSSTPAPAPAAARRRT